jgi:hypothetical protein
MAKKSVKRDLVNFKIIYIFVSTDIINLYEYIPLHMHSARLKPPEILFILIQATIILYAQQIVIKK